MKKIILLLALIINCRAFGQLANGSVAPDFTLTDYYGNTHNLYSYLNSGKTVYLEIFAAHCPGCWSYHQTRTLKSLYNLYGPSGTNEIMVLALEHDEYNDSNAFKGIGDPWVTQGNWLTGTPYPQFNVEGWPDRNVFVDYKVTSYPIVYKICPNKILERVYTSATQQQLYQKAQNCQTMSISEEQVGWELYYNHLSGKVVVNHLEKIEAVTIINLNGQLVKKLNSVPISTIDVSDLAEGVYFFKVKTESDLLIKKLQL